ncbi:oligopeptidase B [Raphidocelis subcapitata]|uniref:Prolyl endopeptidase-like n=1 Tax=Raphidocelis subcapitata TaxID=307507 RepID=A0A2V0NMX0_9CHLO|nr:oligopeptidase B [Raphidocelis subcapitata]|eukprot:GBF88888.1 oligopeptidase B [Raphidocelis subcapitata]
MGGPQGVAVAAAAAAAGAAAGYVLGRRSGDGGLRRMLNGNYSWMSSGERALAGGLASNGHGHLLRGWPRPGVRDEQKRRLLAAAAARLGGAGGELEEARLQVLQPPTAPKRPHAIEAHNDARPDDYYWLRDDARKDGDVIAYLKAENEYTEAVLEDTKQLQDKLYREMRGRIKEEDVSVPTRYKGYWYYSRTAEGQQYKVHCRVAVPPGAGPHDERDAPPGGPGPGGAFVGEEVLLDENARKEEGGHKFYMVSAVEESPDQRLLAWAEDTVGGEKYALHVKFYTLKDHLDRPYRVMRHRIGTPPSQDVLVYEEGDEAFYVGIGRDSSDEMLYIHSGSAVTSEVRFLPADDPTGEFRVVLPRQQDVEYSVSHHPGPKGQEGGGWFLLTIRDAEHPNSEVRAAPVADPAAQTVVVPHRPDVKIEAASASAKYATLNERADAATRVVVHRLPPGGAAPDGPFGAGEVMAFDEAVYSLSGGLTGEFDSDVLRLHYDSLTTPHSVIDHHIPSGRRATRKVHPVLGGFSRDDYESERLWAAAPDGTRVPVSVVYRKGLYKRDGTGCMLLHGYGSYEHSYDPSFDSKALSLLDRGWAVGIAHIRGGGDMGRLWYEDGKYLKKKNTFTDFIACAQHLVDNGYTSPQSLCIEGRSAGGLLMGAVLNMRPDLFHAALAGVPFVDCLTTMLDETIPLTTIEWEEWGNPSQPEYYDYMNYPNILVTAGLHDPRVGYWEPAKWVAKLRSLKTDSNLLLLKTELGAGHFSVTGRFERLKEVALEYAFLLKASGQLDAQPAPGSGATAAAAAAADGSAPVGQQLPPPPRAGGSVSGRRRAVQTQAGGSGLLENSTLTTPGKSSESSTTKPPIYKVMLHNDDHNRREYVVKVLVKVVEGLDVDAAVVVMQTAHESGVSLVLACAQELAEGYVQSLRINGLISTLEPGH